MPREQLKQLAEKALANGGGNKAYFQFTCKWCKQRCTLADENYLPELGQCFKCGRETAIETGGYMLVLEMPVQGVTPVPNVELAGEGD